ncbi:MAG: tyrosine-protein phosphatase [Arenicellales bacterium]|nr:tyrosine-protein phosphatase [Arenicellales bacterium]
MFRSVKLPESVPGRLLLHSMPGRDESWDAFVTEARRVNLDTIVCLTPEEEIVRKSPSYASARAAKRLPCGVKDFVIPDFRAPTETEKKTFQAFVASLADTLRAGKTCLMHCAGGIGRTGTVATCLLLELGVDIHRAKYEVEHAGSYPEVTEQDDFIVWYSKPSR